MAADKHRKKNRKTDIRETSRMVTAECQHVANKHAWLSQFSRVYRYIFCLCTFLFVFIYLSAWRVEYLDAEWIITSAVYTSCNATEKDCQRSLYTFRIACLPGTWNSKPDVTYNMTSWTFPSEIFLLDTTTSTERNLIILFS